MPTSPFRAGAAAVDVTPTTSQFLHGYPHAERMSTGVHDPLMAGALCLQSGGATVLFVTVDVLYVDTDLATRARRRISQATGVDVSAILITATHTHSGPILADLRLNKTASNVPEPDARQVQRVEDGIVAAAQQAHAAMTPAQWAMVHADATGIGTNRHNPAGPALLQTPVLCVRRADDQRLLALMMVVTMHPTVMHEDSKLVSADFPGMTRQYLQAKLGPSCAILHHMGAAGNQSPRHVTKANTFAEAQRLGEILGRAVERVLAEARWQDAANLWHEVRQVELVPRPVVSVEQAQRELDEAYQRLARLRQQGAARQDVRTAECDSFGAEATLGFAKAAQTGAMQAMVERFRRVEVIAVGVSPWCFVGWPSEVFVEWALELQARFPQAIMVTVANGRIPGYLVTPEAVEGRWYEGTNALFQSPQSPQRLLETSVAMLQGRVSR